MAAAGIDSTVAWEGALTCPCGRPYILLKVDEVFATKNRELQPLALYVRCPVHRRVRRLFLPYSQLAEWIGAVASRFFRCNTCGAPSKLAKVGVKGHFSVVLLSCPVHGTNDNKRVLWSPIYTSAKAVQEIQLAETSPVEELFDEGEESGSAPTCPHCGTENDSDARFCAYCGRPLEL